MRNNGLGGAFKGVRVAIGFGIAAAYAGAAVAQTAPAATPPPAPKSITIVTPHAPVARQIEPLVPPVKRVKPNAVAAKQPIKKTSPVAASTASPAPAAASSANALAPAAPDPAQSPTATTPQSATPKSASGTATTHSLTTHAASAVIPHPPTRGQKVVTTTCVTGRGSAGAHKTCVVPGVSRVATAKSVGAKKAAAIRGNISIDQTGRSALGVRTSPKR